VDVFAEARARGFDLKLLDIGGGFPAHYDDTVPSFKKLAKMLNSELDRLFPDQSKSLPSRGVSWSPAPSPPSPRS